MKSNAASTKSGIALQAADLWKSYDQGAIAVLKGMDIEVRGRDGCALWAVGVR